MAKITGTLLYSWAVCKREAWLMAHEINPDEDNPYLELGRFISRESFPRTNRRELILPGMKLDLLETEEGEEVVIAEVKKSSRAIEAARLQVLFYLFRLREEGLNARGELRIPQEKKRIPVELDEEGCAIVQQAIEDLEKLVEQPLPPPAVRIPFCQRCAYREFCWADLESEIELEVEME